MSKRQSASNNETHMNSTFDSFDVICGICRSIMIEPVTMPCQHSLCMSCFQLNVAQTALACPFCRQRISIWVRKNTKSNTLVNEELWAYIKDNFAYKIEARLNGLEDSEEEAITESWLRRPKECNPGEIRQEFEAQLKSIHEEEDQRKKKEEEASTAVITELQKEYDELQKSAEHKLKSDFDFAQQLRHRSVMEDNNCASSPGLSPVGSGKTTKGPMDFFLKGAVNDNMGERCHSTPKGKNTVFHARQLATMSFLSSTSIVAENTISGHPSNLYNRCNSNNQGSYLQDITMPYSSSSCSESENDSNKSPRYQRKRKFLGKFRSNNIENEDPTDVQNLCLNTCETGSNFETQDYVEALEDMSSVDETTLSGLRAEQEALEQRLVQEEQDRKFAIQLSKQYKQIDRRKGTEDEYSLRDTSQLSQKSDKKGPKRTPVRVASVTKVAHPTSHNRGRLKQQTIVQSLAKKRKI